MNSKFTTHVKQDTSSSSKDLTKLTIGLTPAKTRNNISKISSQNSIVTTPTRQHQSVFAKALTSQQKIYEHRAPHTDKKSITYGQLNSGTLFKTVDITDGVQEYNSNGNQIGHSSMSGSKNLYQLKNVNQQSFTKSHSNNNMMYKVGSQQSQQSIFADQDKISFDKVESPTYKEVIRERSDQSSSTSIKLMQQNGPSNLSAPANTRNQDHLQKLKMSILNENKDGNVTKHVGPRNLFNDHQTQSFFKNTLKQSNSRSQSKLFENLNQSQASSQNVNNSVNQSLRQQKFHHRQPRQTRSIASSIQKNTIQQAYEVELAVSSPSQLMQKSRLFDKSEQHDISTIDFISPRQTVTIPKQQSFLIPTISALTKQRASMSPVKKKMNVSPVKFSQPINLGKGSYQQMNSIKKISPEKKYKEQNSFASKASQQVRAQRPSSKRGVAETSVTRKPLENQLRSKVETLKIQRIEQSTSNQKTDQSQQFKKINTEPIDLQISQSQSMIVQSKTYTESRNSVQKPSTAETISSNLPVTQTNAANDRELMYKKKQDEIIKQIQTNMLKSEQLDRQMKQSISYVYPKADLHKIEAKDFSGFRAPINSTIKHLDDTSKEFLDDEISEMRPYCKTSIQQPQNSLVTQARKGGPPKPPQSSTSAVKSPHHSETVTAFEQSFDNGLESPTVDQFPKQSSMFIRLNQKSLLAYEQTELQSIAQVYYYQTPSLGDSQQWDDEDNYYQVSQGDHILYRFEVLKVLGKGSFAQVISAYDHKTQTNVAIKINRNTEIDHKFALAESELLQFLMKEDPQDKNNIVRLTEHLHFRNHQCFTFELLYKDLFEHMKDNDFTGFPIDQIRIYAKQILTALCFLEQRNIIHCDLKPENILLCDSQAQLLKVVDFGSGCETSKQIYTYVQSRFYRSPEVILRIQYSPKVDIWSLGCIMAELFTGEPLFPGNNEQEQLEYMMELLGIPEPEIIDQSRKKDQYFDTDYSPFLIEDPVAGILRIPESKSIDTAVPSDDKDFQYFILNCLKFDPQIRFTAKEALKHPFITQRKQPDIKSYQEQDARMYQLSPDRDFSKLKRQATQEKTYQCSMLNSDQSNSTYYGNSSFSKSPQKSKTQLPNQDICEDRDVQAPMIIARPLPMSQLEKNNYYKKTK